MSVGEAKFQTRMRLLISQFFAGRLIRLSACGNSAGVGGSGATL